MVHNSSPFTMLIFCICNHQKYGKKLTCQSLTVTGTVVHVNFHMHAWRQGIVPKICSLLHQIISLCTCIKNKWLKKQIANKRGIPLILLLRTISLKTKSTDCGSPYSFVATHHAGIPVRYMKLT